MANEKEPRLVVMDKKLKKKAQALARKSFLKNKAEKEQELRPLCDDLEQVFNRSYQFKMEQVIESAERLIERHLEKNPEAILSISDKVLKNIAEHTDVEIQAHPSDTAILSTALPHTFERNLIISADESIKRGSLVVKADKSIIDAHLSTQLGRAKAILLTW